MRPLNQNLQKGGAETQNLLLFPRRVDPDGAGSAAPDGGGGAQRQQRGGDPEPEERDRRTQEADSRSGCGEIQRREQSLNATNERHRLSLFVPSDSSEIEKQLEDVSLARRDLEDSSRHIKTLERQMKSITQERDELHRVQSVLFLEGVGRKCRPVSKLRTFGKRSERAALHNLLLKLIY